MTITPATRDTFIESLSPLARRWARKHTNRALTQLHNQARLAQIPQREFFDKCAAGQKLCAQCSAWKNADLLHFASSAKTSDRLMHECRDCAHKPPTGDELSLALPLIEEADAETETELEDEPETRPVIPRKKRFVSYDPAKHNTDSHRVCGIRVEPYADQFDKRAAYKKALENARALELAAPHEASECDVIGNEEVSAVEVSAV